MSAKLSFFKKWSFLVLHCRYNWYADFPSPHGTFSCVFFGVRQCRPEVSSKKNVLGLIILESDDPLLQLNQQLKMSFNSFFFSQFYVSISDWPPSTRSLKKKVGIHCIFKFFIVCNNGFIECGSEPFTKKQICKLIYRTLTKRRVFVIFFL